MSSRLMGSEVFFFSRCAMIHSTASRHTRVHSIASAMLMSIFSDVMAGKVYITTMVICCAIRIRPEITS